MIYTVQKGDTLHAVAERYGTTDERLAWLNQIPRGQAPVPGQALLISDRKWAGPWQVEMNGFAYPFVSPWVLRETMDHVGLLSVFSYGFTADGDLLPPLAQSTWLTEQTLAAGVDTALVLTPLDDSQRFNDHLIHRLTGDRNLEMRLLEQIRQEIVLRSFRQVNVDFEYVPAEDKERFAEFVALAAQELPVPVTVCLAPKTSADQKGAGYEGKDYRLLGMAADRALLMTYEWGYKYGPPMAVAPLDQVRRVAEYALTEIPAEKLSLGLANYGYDWPLPYERQKTTARTLGSIEAVAIARQMGAEIQWDEKSASPWYTYHQGGTEHVVWFEDLRSWQAKCSLIRELGLTGIGIWNLMNLNRPGLYLLGEIFSAERML